MDENSISVIVPVHNGGQKFKKCLDSLERAVDDPKRIIVVADGESDGAWRMARGRKMRVLKLDNPGGPARARNRGAQMAETPILFFTDADVVIASDTLEKIASTFNEEPELAAMIGSYDDSPAEKNFLSQYKNLAHHFVHQNAHTDAFTFWGACGAIRKEVFARLGGFDESYRFPSIEDIELGYRIKAAGYKIKLEKKLEVKHLKKWTAVSLLKADILYRALPWSELILKKKRMENDLNLKISDRISVASAFALLFSLAGGIFFPRLLALALFSAVLLLAMNADMYIYFQKKRGAIFCLKAIFWHWFYFLYGGAALAFQIIRFGVKRASAS